MADELNLQRLDHRQEAAGILLVFIGVVAPLAAALVLFCVYVWLLALKIVGFIHGPDDIHDLIFGWLTTYRHENGHRIATPNNLPVVWFVAWLQVYIFYQFVELLAWLVRSFAGLARKGGKRDDDEDPRCY